jgi:hypothetical protein
MLAQLSLPWQSQGAIEVVVRVLVDSKGGNGDHLPVVYRLVGRLGR